MTRNFRLNKYSQSEGAKAIRKLDALHYLNSSAHGTVPVLRAGAETYLWMPATSGGENVWRHVLTTGISPGSARKKIALKAGNPTNSDLRFDERYGKGTAAKLFKLSKTTEQWEIGELEQLTGAAKHSMLAYQTLYDQLAQ